MFIRITEEDRNLCVKLSLGQAQWAARLRPNKNLLAFSKNADLDGFIGDMSGKTQVTIETYQIKMTLIPGNMEFEASMAYHKVENKFVLKVGCTFLRRASTRFPRFSSDC